jgi:hypothetical protein
MLPDYSKYLTGSARVLAVEVFIRLMVVSYWISCSSLFCVHSAP